MRWQKVVLKALRQGAQSQELLNYALAKSSSKGFALRGTKPRTAKLCAGKK